MDTFVIVSLVILLALGAFFVIPKSQKKDKAKETVQMLMERHLGAIQRMRSQNTTRKDCWIIIKDKVYDVTPYVEEHPGGDAILNNAGDDSSEGFFGLRIMGAYQYRKNSNLKKETVLLSQ